MVRTLEKNTCLLNDLERGGGQREPDGEDRGLYHPRGLCWGTIMSDLPVS